MMTSVIIEIGAGVMADKVPNLMSCWEAYWVKLHLLKEEHKSAKPDEGLNPRLQSDRNNSKATAKMFLQGIDSNYHGMHQLGF